MSEATTTAAAGADSATAAATIPAVPPVDLSAITQAAVKDARDALLAQFKDTTGFDSLEAFKDAELKSQGKLQELVDSKSLEAQSYKAKYEQTAISNALLGVAGEAVDPADIVAALSGKGSVDASGVVTIDGKPVSDAVAALLAAKPHWAKAQGSAGSGASTSAAAAAEEAAAGNGYQAAAKSGNVLDMLKLNTGATA